MLTRRLRCIRYLMRQVRAYEFRLTFLLERLREIFSSNGGRISRKDGSFSEAVLAGQAFILMARKAMGAWNLN